MSHLLWLIPVLPLIGFLINGTLRQYPSSSASFTSLYRLSAARAVETRAAARAESAGVATRVGAIRMCGLLSSRSSAKMSVNPACACESDAGLDAGCATWLAAGIAAAAHDNTATMKTRK